MMRDNAQWTGDGQVPDPHDVMFHETHTSNILQTQLPDSITT